MSGKLDLPGQESAGPRCVGSERADGDGGVDGDGDPDWGGKGDTVLNGVGELEPATLGDGVGELLADE